MAARLVFSLLLAVACSHAALAAAASSSSSSSAVEDTCAKATASGSRKDLAPFCVSTLQAAPGSAGADARGLAVIATNLTLANYTAAYATIKALQRRGGWSEREQSALATCRQLYIEALNVVHSAIHALNTGQAQAYVADMGVVRRAATGCEDAFGVGGVGVGNQLATESPLHKVDDDAINLTTVAMLIVLIL
uniref:Pectinesterase inhibitor domain-containing protein n=1 Tax=Oryza punctata TaxID=4537 RepID=A0A0E0KR42_ORYPU